jgi:hypothetical protein
MPTHLCAHSCTRRPRPTVTSQHLKQSTMFRAMHKTWHRNAVEHMLSRRKLQEQARSRWTDAVPAFGGLQSFTSQLNLSAYNGVGGVLYVRDCVARGKGVSGGV